MPFAMLRSSAAAKASGSLAATVPGAAAEAASTTGGSQSPMIPPIVDRSFRSPVSGKRIKYFHTLPIHTLAHHSPLSSESPVQNYRGFFNLCILLLAVSNMRLVFENYRKYGILLTLPGSAIPGSDMAASLVSLLIMALAVLASLLLEKIACRNVVPDMVLYYGMGLNVAVAVLAPIYIIWCYMVHFSPGLVVLFICLILGLKLISYHLVNCDLRSEKRLGIADDHYPDCPYPTNVSLANILYFWLAPTLCYQPLYPRTAAFRWAFFLKRMAEFFSAFSVMYFLLEQYALPTVVNSMQSLHDLDIPILVERALKLSISSIYIWLLLFYMIFHALLNALAEVLRFADRAFYLQWWNASSIDEYWRLWNLPVHSWMKRHIYLPLRSRGVPSAPSLSITFFVSAILHEVAVGVPAHVVQLWAFGGILFQIPLIWVTKWLVARKSASSFSNCLFWCTFCIVGQPMCILLYYYSWATKSSLTQFLFQ